MKINKLKLGKGWLSVIILFSVMAVVFFPYFLGYADLHTGLIYTDLWLFNYPLKNFYREMLLLGKLPFWTSLIGNGYPIFAEGQVGALYPLNLFFYRILPTLTAYNLNLFAHFFLSGLFTYLFTRRSLNLSKKASLLSAFCYPFSGYYVLHTHQINIDIVITYLPLSLYLASKLVTESNKLKYSLFLGLVFSLQIFAGHMEMFYYSVVLTAVYMFLSFIFVREAKDLRRFVYLGLGFGVSLLLAIGITFVQLYPTYELNSLSQRSAGIGVDEAMQSRWPVKSLLLLIDPKAMPIYSLNSDYKGVGIEDASITEVYIYIGALAFLLASYSVIKNRSRQSVVFSIMLLLSLVYAFGNYTQFYTILWETLPGLKFFRYPSKIAFFVAFSLSILAGCGYDLATSKLYTRFKNKNYNKYLIGALALLVLDPLIFNIWGTRKLVKGSDWLKAPPAAEFLKDKIGSPYNFKIYSHGTNNLDYGLARDAEVQKKVQNILPRDFNMLYNIPNNREWVVLFIETQTGLNQERTVLDYENKRILLKEDYKKSLALQNVKYLVSDVAIYDKDYKQVAFYPFSKEIDHSFYLGTQNGQQQVVNIPSEGVHMYESDVYYPRAYFVTGYEVVKDDATHKVLREVLSDSFNPLEKVILENEPKINSNNKNGGKCGSCKVEIVSDKQDEVDIRAEVDSDGFLVLGDTYYPGWRVWIDGKEGKILKANYGQRAVPLQKGTHSLVMKYMPSNWNTAVEVSTASLVIVAVLLSAVVLRERSQKKRK